MTPILESELHTHESALFRALVVESPRVLDGQPSRHFSRLSLWLIGIAFLIVFGGLVPWLANLPGQLPEWAIYTQEQSR